MPSRPPPERAAAPDPAPGGPPAEARAALADLYARLDAVVAARSPRCEMSGRCCDFPRSGQRLYATDLETDHALAEAAHQVPPAASGLCPWYVDGLCTLRRGRPLGCRIYFCDPDWAGDMSRVYETFHAELRGLHERFGLRYVYRPFVEAVAERARLAADVARRGSEELR